MAHRVFDEPTAADNDDEPVAPADRYDPDAEIRARAMAQIREIVAAQPARAAGHAYRSETPRAHERRALLRRAADENRRRVMGLPSRRSNAAA
jgi:hypothetical protein